MCRSVTDKPQRASGKEGLVVFDFGENAGFGIFSKNSDR